MTPLASVMLLAFLFLIALVLVIWALLLPRSKTPPTPERERVAPPPRESTVSNDDVRGVKSAGSKRPAAPDDAFERFIRAGRDDERN